MLYDIVIALTEPTSPKVSALLAEHLVDMYAASPACSVHALDADALSSPGISFYVAERDGVVVACGAIKSLGVDDAELKSMRTVAAARGQGVGAKLLEHLIAEARGRGVRALRLETGTEEYFAPARRLYERHGFVEGESFSDYLLDPNSVYMHLYL